MTDLTPPTEATPAEPLRDPRPWEVCTRGSIRKGDLVDARVDDRLYLGVAYHQDEDGDWWTEGGVRLTCDVFSKNYYLTDTICFPDDDAPAGECVFTLTFAAEIQP